MSETTHRDRVRPWDPENPEKGRPPFTSKATCRVPHLKPNAIVRRFAAD